MAEVEQDKGIEQQARRITVTWEEQEARRLELEERRLRIAERELDQREAAIVQIDELQPAQLREWQDIQEHRAITREADDEYRQSWRELVEKQTELMERQTIALEAIARLFRPQGTTTRPEA